MKERAIKAWPEWKIGECIGKGGFGAVYKMSRDVFGDKEEKALKIISIPFDESEFRYMKAEGMDDISIAQSLFEQVGEIAREYKLMQKLQGCPNIVHTDDFKSVQHISDPGWDIFIRMELLTPIMDALNKVSSERAVIELGMAMCNALLTCEKHNIIHRDIKPQNIFISPDGYFKLGDFGIAKTVEHSVGLTAGVGTYNFMAPEVALGKHYSSTADIYSLGLVLYWLLNERRGPFMPLPPSVPSLGDNESARERRYRGEPLPMSKHGSAALRAVVMKACAFDPNERYQSAAGMMEELSAIVTSRTISKNTLNNSVAGEDDPTVRENSGKRSVSIKQQTSKPKAEKEAPSVRQSGTYLQNKTGAKKKSKWPIAVVAVIVLVAIIAGFAMMGGSNHEDISVSHQETENDTLVIDTTGVTVPSTEYSEATAATTEPTTTVPNTIFDVVAPEDPQRNILVIHHSEEDGEYPATYMLLTYHRESWTLSVTSILKDSYVSIPDYMGHYGGYTKLEYVYALGKKWNGEQGGKDMIVACLKDNFGIEVDEIVFAEDQALKTIVDELNGVDVWVSMEDISRITLMLMGNEYVSLSGESALRYVGIDSDQNNIHRTGCQRNLLISIIEKCKKTPVAEILEVINATYPWLNTDLSSEEIARYIVEMNHFKIEEATYPAEGTYWGEIVDFSGQMLSVLKFENENEQSSNTATEETIVLALEKEDITIASGLSLKLALKYGVDPAMVTWSSKDEDIVTVNESGEIKAHKAGTSRVYVRYGNQEDSVIIRVVEN